LGWWKFPHKQGSPAKIRELCDLYHMGKINVPNITRK